MSCSRREFFSGASAFALGAGRLFAVPPGWKPSKKPDLVLGVISDTHIRTMPTSGRIDREWSDRYLVKALTHFRDENVDAVVHCGDFAHLGQIEEMQAHADAWIRAFPNNRAPAGHEVVKLFVVGNHELRGSTYGGKGMFVRRLYPDPEERARHVLASDMAGNWERIWGEKYEPVWHKVVKGFHFFGMQWGVDDAAMADLVDGTTGCEPPRPFFVLRHDYPPSTLLARMKRYPNAVGFFGHLHYSIANWRKVFLAGGMPWFQVPSLHSHGYPGLREEDPWLTKLKIEGMEAAGSVRARQGMVIRLYDDMMVVERREFGEGGSLGADWVMPFGKYDPHPFSLEEQKKKIGEPQFRAGAELEVFLDRIDKIENTTNLNPVNPVQEDSASLRLCVKIPLADGNPDSRVYAYEVVVAGEGQKLHKIVYAAGCNMGIGHEPNGGITDLPIPKSELPSGDVLTIAARPLTSLGTSGKPLVAKWHKSDSNLSPAGGAGGLESRRSLNDSPKDMNARARGTIAAVGGVLCCTLFTMSTFAELCGDGVGVMSIAGRWRFALGNSTNCTDTIDLPFTTDIARKGDGRINARELEKIDPMRDDAYLTDALTRHPTRRFPYVGPATYERDVDIPAEWAGKRIELMVERTKFVSVYFDGKPIGRCETLATPAVVELPRGTSPGRHRLRLVVDNGLRGRPLSGHQISDDTQTNWNGVMGRMELRAYGETSIVHVKTFPCAAEDRVTAKVEFRNDGVKKKLNVEICAAEASALRQQAYNNKSVKRSFPYVAPCGVSTGEFNVVLGPDAPKWSEFNPVLYKLTVKAGEASSTVKFGLRDFKTDGGRFILNGRPVFLRGRLDSCVWPLTGAPPMEVEPWRRYFATLKEYGLNHVRFHSWCPPEAAFEAADEAGFYLQPEFASFGGDMGRNVRLRTYCLAESKRILDAYANHPSFVMFTLGNEYCSGREAHKAVVRELRRYDSRPLYAQATNNDYPRPRQCEGDDFWVTFRSYDGPEGNARGSYAHCNAPLGAVQLPGGGTMRDFSSAMRYCTIPIVAHETGQFQAYPDYSEIAKYTGVLKPLNFEVFRARLAKAGLLEYAADFSRASGRLMAINYREEMEEAFRTPGFDGFQLLDIQDYPGQGSALVGILDAFMDSKGFITPEEWRMSCAPTVLLARFPRYTYVAGEKFCADVQIVHYGKEDALKGDLAWRIVAEGGTRPVVAGGSLKAEVPLGEVTTIGRIAVDLPRTERAQKFMLELSLTDGSAKNAYPLWVYPEVGGVVPQGVEIMRDLESAEKALAEGRRALCILDQARAPTNSVPGFFASDFCCWALFNASCARRGGKNVAPGTLGLLVKDKHPALAGFPTSFHSDYQWRELIFKGVNVVLEGNKDADVIVRGIDNVTLNRNLGVIWEKRRGKGRVVYCSLDLEAAKDLPEARALRQSLLDYMSTMK